MLTGKFKTILDYFKAKGVQIENIEEDTNAYTFTANGTKMRYAKVWDNDSQVDADYMFVNYKYQSLLNSIIKGE